jgi:hypothetical protein
VSYGLVQRRRSSPPGPSTPAPCRKQLPGRGSCSTSRGWAILGRSSPEDRRGKAGRSSHRIAERSGNEAHDPGLVRLRAHQTASRRTSNASGQLPPCPRGRGGARSARRPAIQASTAAGSDERGQSDKGTRPPGRRQHPADGLVPVNVGTHRASRTPSMTWPGRYRVIPHVEMWNGDETAYWVRPPRFRPEWADEGGPSTGSQSARRAPT